MDSNTLQNTFDWIKACQEPSEKLANIQMGVFFEEIAETLREVVIKSQQGNNVFKSSAEIINLMGNLLKLDDLQLDLNKTDYIKLLDGLCDVIVTATTTAYALGFDLIGAMNEVNRANYSKFVDGKPIYDENGKITKGPNYVRPNLEPYINKDQ